MDRSVHAESYPRLTYPQMYLLNKGYKQFFADFPELCDPRQYVTMVDTRFQNECRSSFSELRKSFKSQKRARSSSVCLSASSHF